MIAFQLHESYTHKLRRYELQTLNSNPPAWDFAHAHLWIKLGEVGPRGGTSKMKHEEYYVQEPPNDPLAPSRLGRTFYLAKLSGQYPNVNAIPDDPPDCLYECFIAPRPTVGYCTCTGHKTQGKCKHYDTLEHLVNVVGMVRGFVVADTVERVKCCGLEWCELCQGTGWVEIEPVTEWGYYS